MRSYITMVFLVLLSLIPFYSAQASLDPEVNCSIYGANAQNCDQCFDGGSIYTGEAFAPYDVFNAGNADRILFAHENPTVWRMDVLNNQTNWFASEGLIRYPPNLTWYTQASTGHNYLHFRKHTSTRFLETVPGRFVRFNDVSGNLNNINPNQPAMRFTFIATYRTWHNNTLSNPRTHRECVFYKPSFCGDGILQPDRGEVCDPNDPNQVGFGNGGCDPVTCQPINDPSCNALTVSTNSGEAPLNVTATCEGFKVNTWQIDCGNGQVFSGSGNNSGVQSFQETCTYESAGNFSPRCTINGSITNNSCRKSVSVTSPLDPSILVDKTDANPHDLDGEIGNDTQTVYKGERAVFRIRVTNNGNEMLRNIRLTDPKATACATLGTTTVDLENNHFINQNNEKIEITQGGAGNKNDNRLAPGEWFEYICSEPDSQSDYINTVGTTGVGITTGRTVSDTDPTAVIVIDKPKPRIEVDKRDANPNDLDGDIGGNDSQTVRPGDSAIFSIVVTNNGSEDLEDITLIDEKAPACATADGTFVDLENKRFTNKLGETVHIDVFGQGNHTDNIFQVGEKFGYTCEEPDTQENYTNVVEVIGTGITSRKTVTDDDSTAVVIETKPSIRVIKLDANPNDLDGEKFNDTQTVLKGTEAIFHIRVVNNGAETLRNIVLIDPVAPACATADGTFVDLQNKQFTNKLGQTISINTDGQGNHDNNTLEVGEEFTYTCSRDDTQNDYINTVDVEGTGLLSGDVVTDSDTTEVLVVDTEPNISIDKTDANPDDLDGIIGNDTQTVNKGDRAVFEITVINTGSEPLRNVTLNDEKAPACATADDTFVDFINYSFTNQLGDVVEIEYAETSQSLGANNEFKTGAIFTYTCEEGDTQNDYINTVRVDAIGVESEQDVNDSDDTIILIKEDDEDSACLNLIANPSSSQNSLTTTLTCTGNENADSFRIEVRNPSDEIVNTINAHSGQITLPLIGGNATNYTASCFVNDEDSAIPACTTNLSVTTGGGGGPNHQCVDIEQRNSNVVRCTGLSANVMGITYTSSGSTMQQKKDNLSMTDAGRVFADFTLPDDATNIQCLASKNGLEPIAEGLQDWRGGQQCRFVEDPFCGDGVIDTSKGHNCDFGAPINAERWGKCGLPGTPNECRISTNGGGTPPPVDCDSPGVECGVITVPEDGEFRFGPSGEVIVGYNQYPLARNPNAIFQYPVVKNISDYDISFEAFCIKSRDITLVEVQNGNTSTPGEICVDIENRKIYPYEELYLVRDGTNYRVVNQYHDMITNPDSIHNYEHFKVVNNSVQSGDYRDTTLVTSVKDTVPLTGGGSQQFAFYDTFLAANLKVRVARPAVTTIGGGTSYVKSTTTSDVATITTGFGNFGTSGNTNFVGTSVSESGISSDTASIDDTSASSGDGDMQGGLSGVDGDVATSNFENYNQLNNVFIKTGDVEFDQNNPQFMPENESGARTYIIENGDVTISENITINDNIAIIVRNGNINIKSSVTQINATLMILNQGFITGEPSENQLRVNGALYGNIDNLVQNRYFIDDSGSTLSVGTIVSFGSNLLRRPAPLLSQFVGEYLESQRVAR